MNSNDTLKTSLSHLRVFFFGSATSAQLKLYLLGILQGVLITYALRNWESMTSWRLICLDGLLISLGAIVFSRITSER